jgi:hypothetical protein
VSAWQTNYGFTGKTFDDLRLDCSLLYKGEGSGDPKDFDDKAWLTSFYTTDGEKVFALIHDEFHGREHPGVCHENEQRRCWFNVITSTVSLDGGKHFEHVSPPKNVVAVLPYRYGAVLMPAGYFAPSNIVKMGAFFYVLVRAEARGGQRSGSCLLRTQTLFDSQSWRAWNGSEFAVKFIDPFRLEVNHPEEHLCTPVTPRALIWPVSSLVFHKKTGMFVAIMQANIKVPRGGNYEDGVYYATSPDLINWSSPRLLMPALSVFTYKCGGDPIMHPSLIDPASSDRNFTDFADEPFLFYSFIHLNGCRLSHNIDIMRIRLRVKGG